MALKGTLKDFGIADILQLIGQQQKTGTLHLVSKQQVIDVMFQEGVIVAAVTGTRRRVDLIGNMLVRAELISELELQSALEAQKRDPQRIGDVLVGQGSIDEGTFRKMVRLQTTETLYALFEWTSGTYAFEQGEIDYDPKAATSLRAESVLMEGFRQVDEWPPIKKCISNYQITFEPLKDLPGPTPELDDPPPEGEEERGADGLLHNERQLLGLVAPGRDVRKLIDLSRQGEFETCKALSVLVERGYLRAVAPAAGATPLEAGRRLGSGVKAVLGWAVAGGGVLGLVIALGSRVQLSGVGERESATVYADPALQRYISFQQRSRIAAALTLYRLEKGELPEQLAALVEAKMLAAEDLRYPWRDEYYYRRASPSGFVLLPPLR